MPKETANPARQMTGKLYLIPASLGAEDINQEIPSANSLIVSTLNEFIVENVRTARRFLRKAGFTRNFDEVKFHILDKHTPDHILPEFLKNITDNNPIGLLSEAGYPCIADPGQKIVRKAHEQNIRVIPLVGPSSILMALVSSGFNGQSFVFHGYLPIDKKERVHTIKLIEREALRKGQTQIFMETPFRNNALLADILQNCSNQTLLCVASNITCNNEYIQTMNIAQWKKNTPDLHKMPSVFLLYKE